MSELDHSSMRSTPSPDRQAMSIAPAEWSLPGLLRRHWVLLAILVAHALIWTLLDQVVSPHPDYIDHWMQSRIFSWGYAEHPPMIAWWIHGLTRVLGESEAGLEASAILVNLLILTLLYSISAWRFGRTAGVLTLVSVEATPYFFGGTPLLLIDQPLQVFWLLALWALLAYQRSRRPGWLLAAGLAAGLGALSKYTMVLFYLSGLVYVLLVPSQRKELLNPFQALGGAIALAIFSPVLVWNAQHGWESILYQLSKGEPERAVYPGKHVLEFTGGYVLLFSAVLVIAGGAILWRRLRREGRQDTPAVLLGVFAVTPVLFFMLAMIRGSFPDPQYANVGFVSFYILLGAELADRWRARRAGVLRLMTAAYAWNLLLLGLIGAHAYHPFLNMAKSVDPTEQIVGWNLTGQQVADLLAERRQPPPKYVISYYYPLSSQFALHLPSRPYTFTLARLGRNLWVNPDEITPENSIIVCQDQECGWMSEQIPKVFHRGFEPLGTVSTTLWGVPRRTVTVMRMTGPAAR